MKNLCFLLLLFCNNLFGQLDNHTSEVLMASMTQRIEAMDTHQESIKEIKMERRNRENRHWCCLLITDCLESLEISVDIKDQINELPRIEGLARDKVSQEPLLFASVALYRNDIIVTGTETDLDGNFILAHLETGVYDLEFSYVGYQTLRVKNVTVGPQQKIDAIKIIPPVPKLNHKYKATCSVVEASNCGPIINIAESKARDYKITELSDETELEFDLYPNPTVDFVNIQVLEDASSLIIRDEVGRLILSKQKPEPGLYKLSTQDYPVGIYFVSLVVDNKIVTEQLVIAH